MNLLSPEEVAHLVQEANRLRLRAAQAEDLVQRMSLLNELSRRMNLATTEAEVLQIAAELAPQIVKADRSSIALLTERENEVEIRALKGVVGDVPKGVILALDETDFAPVVREQKFVIQQDNGADASLPQIRARMNAPLITGGLVIGSFNVGSRRAHAFTPEDGNLMMQVSALLASTIENRRLFAKIQASLTESEEEAKRLTLLNKMGQKISLATSQEDVLEIVTQYTPQIIPADLVNIALLSESKDYFDLLTLDPKEHRPNIVQIPAHNTQWAEAIRRRAVVNIRNFNQYDTADAKFMQQQEILSAILAPISAGDRVLGTLNIGRSHLSEYQKRDEGLGLQLATFLGTTLDNLQLYRTTHEKNLALLDALSQLHEAQAQLIQFETMAALGRLVAGVAHEINTPLGIGVTAASVLEEQTNELRALYTNGQLRRQDMEAYLDLAGQSSKLLSKNLSRAAELVQSFKQVAVDQSIEEHRRFQIKAYLEEVLLSIGSELKRTHLRVEIDGDDQISIDSYPGAFGQIMTNLVMNSLIHAYQPGQQGRLRFEIYRQKDQIQITYSDDGCGIPPELIHRVFEPFFTTKRGQGGTGLGLHIVYNLVTQKLGGLVTCESYPGAGTKFMITLPTTISPGSA